MQTVDERGVAEPPTPGPAAAAGREQRTIPYQPALDGVRALAVIVVLLFHAEVAGFDGGYLGVSVFFTLSGFLITSLLATEIEARQRVALGRFYARRARRLLPASVLLVALVVLASAVTDWFDAVADLRAHAVGSLLQVANWVFLANDGSYQELLEQAAGAASPLEHYWSLAIEEQFYWLWPIAFTLLWRVGRSDRGRRLLLGGITLAFFAAAPITAVVWDGDAAYWASPARAGEILAGAFVAVAIMGRTLPRWVGMLAPLALVALGVCVVAFPTSGGPAYAGWLPAIGVLSALLLLGLQVESPVRRACSAGPLVWLGTISYGVYLFHWPIFVVMNEDRMGVDGVALLALRLVTTLVVAQLSYVLYERPIRRATRLAVRPTMLGALAVTAATVAATVAIVPSASSDYWQADAAATEAAALDTDDAPLLALTRDDPSAPDAGAVASEDPSEPEPAPEPGPDSEAEPGAEADDAAPEDPTPATSIADVTTTVPPSTVAPLPELSRPVRIIVAGDSTAAAFGAGVVNWAAFASDLAQAELFAATGCGFISEGEYLLDDEWLEVRDNCTDWVRRFLPERVSEARPDVVMLLTTSFDVLDHRFDDGTAGSPAEIRDRVLAEFEAVTDTLLADGAGAVAWVKGPLPNPFWLSRGSDQEQPDRHAVLHSVMEEIAASRPAVHVIDLGGYFDAEGLTDDLDVRPDGVHVDPDIATDITADFLGDQLVRAALGLL